MTNEEKKQILNFLNNWGTEENISHYIGLEFTDVDDDMLQASMPVNSKVHQPYGMLHGGVSCVLAETLGSCLSNLFIDRNKYMALGTNITSNHLRGIREGRITGTATFIRKGNTMHVSQIEIKDQDGNLINHTVMTNNVIAK